MHFSRRPPLLFAGLLIATASLHAEDRVQERKLREMATDRPDATESPFTVDPGHAQLEMSAATFTTDKVDGVRTTTVEAAPFNVRYGIADAFEVGIFVTPRTWVTERQPNGTRVTHQGFGDIGLRTKINFRGNDGTGTAVGLIADLKLPTAAKPLGNDKYEAALTLPFARDLGGGWDAGAMTSLHWSYTGAGKYQPVWYNTITFGHDLAPGVGGYVELTSTTGDGGHAATFDCGLTRKLDENTQLDCGANIGISRSAPDLALFAGLSRRW